MMSIMANFIHVALYQKYDKEIELGKNIPQIIFNLIIISLLCDLFSVYMKKVKFDSYPNGKLFKINSF